MTNTQHESVTTLIILFTSNSFGIETKEYKDCAVYIDLPSNTESKLGSALHIYTDDRIKALSEQYKELCNLYTQMNSYLELVELKLKSERD